MNIDLINLIVKNYSITLFSTIIMTKLLNIKEYSMKKFIKIMVFVMGTSMIFSITKQYIGLSFAIIILLLALNFFIDKVTETRISLSMVTSLISVAFCFISFAVSATFSYFANEFICKIFKIDNRIVESLCMIIMQWIIISSFFKIKKYKNGFYFLQKGKNNEYIDIVMISISTLIILVYNLFGNYYGEAGMIKPLFITFFTLAIIMMLIIQKTFIMYYKQKLLNDTIKQYEKDLQEKDNEIKKLSNEKYEISRINHEFYNRQKALELKVKEFTAEASDEIGILDRIDNLSKEYSNSLQEIKEKQKLPLTNISEIDDMFRYMQTECNKNNIEFNLHINGDIYHLVNEIIPKNKLETLIGDHIRNAIIAINSSKNENRSILVILGTKEKCYELCIYDSGIEFEIETLNKLGLERATTHKETGGTGIGFMTTFETLKECKASLIIEEKHEMSENDYTKAVKIRFDGKHQYKIESYREEEIRKVSKDKRISIEKLKENYRKSIYSNNNYDSTNNVNNSNNYKSNKNKTYGKQTKTRDNI